MFNNISAMLSPEMLSQRYTLYEQARAFQPVLPVPDLNLWLVFDYEGVRTVLSDYERFSSDFSKFMTLEGGEALRQAMDQTGSVGLANSLIATDPPVHRKLRNLITRAFTPRAVQKLEGWIEQLSNRMLDEALERGEMDFMQDFAWPMPVTVIAQMLGIPAEDRQQFKRWSDQLVASSDLFFLGTERDAQDMLQSRQNNEEMRLYFRDIIRQRREVPRDDLISALLAAEIEGEYLGEEDLLSFCVLLLIAGNITTTHLLGNAIRCFLEYPDELARLRADLSLTPRAIEEVLRFQSPVQAMIRVSLSDVQLGEVTIPANQRVLAFIGSANRDERQFPEAERFVITRDPNPHIAFGFGIHYCIGAPLARLEAEVALRAFLTRVKRFEPVGDAAPPLAEGFILNGVSSLPLRLFTS